MSSNITLTSSGRHRIKSSKKQRSESTNEKRSKRKEDEILEESHQNNATANRINKLRSSSQRIKSIHQNNSYFSDGEYISRDKDTTNIQFNRSRLNGHRIEKYEDYDRRWTFSGSDNDKYLSQRKKTIDDSRQRKKRQIKIQKQYRTKLEYEKMKKSQEDIKNWSNEILKPYYPEVIIENINSFLDGVPLLALLHAYDRSIIDYYNIDKSDPIMNFELAFKLAEEKLHIPNVLDPAMVTEGSHITYLYMYITMIKAKFEELDTLSEIERENRSLIIDLKVVLNQKIAETEFMMNKLKKETDNLSNVLNEEEFQKEKEFYEERLSTAQRMLDQCVLLVNQLLNQNHTLKKQNGELKEKIIELEELTKRERMHIQAMEDLLKSMESYNLKPVEQNTQIVDNP